MNRSMNRSITDLSLEELYQIQWNKTVNTCKPNKLECNKIVITKDLEREESLDGRIIVQNRDLLNEIDILKEKIVELEDMVRPLYYEPPRGNLNKGGPGYEYGKSSFLNLQKII